jgi:PIN domain nuclease of toxin-antitoxin system
MAALGNLSLPVEQAHVLRVAALPLHHKDPFDRVLIAQALVEGLTLITTDPVMRMYEAPIIWAAQ